MKRSKHGFTLLEMLVVISIIAILSGLVVTGMTTAKAKAKVQVTKALISKIAAALESYYAAYGDYPPTDLSDLYLGASNGVNNGIESVVACLSDQNKGGPFLSGIPENKYTNKDGDSCSPPPTNWWFGDGQLREIVDEWNNPLVYFHSRDYDNPFKGSNYSFNISGAAVAPQRNPNTAAFYGATTFQIWSAGMDEKNDNGTGNDVNSWNN